MAEEFNQVNTPETILQFKRALNGIALEFEPRIRAENQCRMPLGSFGPVTRFSTRT